MSQKIAHFPLDFSAEQSVSGAKGPLRYGPRNARSHAEG